MLSSNRHTNAKKSTFTYENILRFTFNMCTKWDSPISKVTGYELDDRSCTSGRVTDIIFNTTSRMAQGLFDFLWRRLFSPGVKDSGIEALTYFDVQLRYKKSEELSTVWLKPFVFWCLDT